MLKSLKEGKKNMKIYQLIEWFQINYPDMHQALLQCNHNFDEKDLNPYHLESDCWSHTMMVCKIAELSHYEKVVQIAALLHDIGKPASRKINPRNNHVQFFGHENLSANHLIALKISKISSSLIIAIFTMDRVLAFADSRKCCAIIIYPSCIYDIYHN